jgi:adenine deaminase
MKERIQTAMAKDSKERARCIDVALKRSPADLVVTNGQLVNVTSGEILPDWGIAFAGRRIAAVGNVSGLIGSQTEVLDAENNYLVPGLIDGHLHIESSRLSPTHFAAAVLPRGTTTVMEDPHELCNVIGLDGVEYFIDANERLPLKIFTQVPSAVPPSPFETSGGDIDAADMARAFQWPLVLGIGEMMNIDEILANEPRFHKMISTGHALRQPVEGHANGVAGSRLDAYTASGIGSDHEIAAEDFLAKLRRGLAIQLRSHSWWQETFEEVVGQVLVQGLDTHQIMLVTDDRDANEFHEIGGMDANLRQAISLGLDPITAIQMATLNPARHFGLLHEVGLIAPGRLGDVLLVEDLQNLQASAVIANGELIAREGELLTSFAGERLPVYVRDTVRLPHKLTAEDFQVKAPGSNNRVEVKMPSYSRPDKKALLPVQGGYVQRDPKRQITKLAVIERHTGEGGIGVGFVQGLGFLKGAVACTISHDAHNLIVVGGADADMAAAVNRCAELGGGLVVCSQGQVLAELPLPIGGLMSDLPAEEVRRKLAACDKAARELGSADWLGQNPTMILTYLALTAANPQTITDKGYVDIEKRQIESIFISKER